MVIQELRAIAPMADVYELRPEVRYIVVVPWEEEERAITTLSDGLRGKVKAGTLVIRARQPRELRIIELADGASL